MDLSLYTKVIQKLNDSFIKADKLFDLLLTYHLSIPIIVI